MASFPPPFESFVAPARARSEAWRLLLGIGIVAASYLGIAFAVFEGAGRLGINVDLDGVDATSMFVFLATFLGMALGPVLAVTIVHRRALGSLFGRAAWVIRDFVLATGLAGAIFGLSVALWSIWFDPMPNLAPGAWLGLLPLALLGVFIQTGAEELLFRGYLQQQLAARLATPLAWAILPSLLFGFAHYDPEGMGANAWLIVAATGLFGLLAADLTARTGSLGAAWGLHFANNVLALLILSLDGPISGLALYTTPYGADAPVLRGLILLDMATVALTWVVLRRVLSR